MNEEVLLTRDGRVLTIEFANPDKANALSAGVVATVMHALSAPAADGLGLVVFKGRGDHFCSGFDLGDLDSVNDADLLERVPSIERLLQHVYHAPFVTLTLAHGSVVGAGADLLCACTLRVAVPETTCRMPGLRFGVALGTRRLMQRVGADRARDLLLTTRRFDARHALDIGLVQRIVEPARWHEVAVEAADSAVTLAPEAVAELLQITTPDTREDDLAALMRTAGRAGLRDRILRYRGSLRGRRGSIQKVS